MRKVAFFGVEMSAEQMAMRFLTARSRIPADAIRRGRLSAEERARVDEGIEWLEREMRPNLVYHGPGKFRSIRDIVYVATYLVRQESVEVVVIDYIQRIGTTRRDKRTEEIGDITSRLKSLAGELGVPVVAVSQVSREAGKEHGGKARLWDMSESASIERDADYVLGLWRPDRHLEKDSVRKHWENVAVLELLKGRFRKTSKCFLRFDGACARFDDLDVNTVKKLRQRELLGDLDIRKRVGKKEHEAS